MDIQGGAGEGSDTNRRRQRERIRARKMHKKQTRRRRKEKKKERFIKAETAMGKEKRRRKTKRGEGERREATKAREDDTPCWASVCGSRYTYQRPPITGQAQSYQARGSVCCCRRSHQSRQPLRPRLALWRQRGKPRRTKTAVAPVWGRARQSKCFGAKLTESWGAPPSPASLGASLNPRRLLLRAVPQPSTRTRHMQAGR